jgi:hypothetical protein
MTGAQPVRYRCTLCGNLTRFDVVERKRTRAFYHFTIGGMLTVDEEEVLERDVEEVRCRWCNTSDNVEEVPAGDVEAGA